MVERDGRIFISYYSYSYYYYSYSYYSYCVRFMRDVKIKLQGRVKKFLISI